MNKERSIRIAGFVILLLCTALGMGVKLVFHACAPMCHGTEVSYMNCHNAEQAVAYIGAALIVLSGVLSVTGSRILRTVTALVIAVGGLAAALVPNTFVKLCMKTDMHCHSVMKPAVIVIGAMIAVACGVYIILVSRRSAD